MAQEHTVNKIPEVGFVRLRTILTVIPVARSTWWAWVAAGKAPTPVKLSPNVTAWRVEDIRDLIEHLGAGHEALSQPRNNKTSPELREAKDGPNN